MAGDPDVQVCEFTSVGVWLGVDKRMPRTPAVFERKRKWRLDETGDEASRTMWAENYSSAKERPE
eukprot:2037897-Heterocapsa_arctica.AAC.1